LSIPVGIIVIVALLLKERSVTPKQEGRVKVVDKRKEHFQSDGPDRITYFFTFEFSDNSRKEISAPSEKKAGRGLSCTVVNDTGTLIYQELSDHTRFIDFERDNAIKEPELSLYDKLYNTYGGSWAVSLLHIILMFIPVMIAIFRSVYGNGELLGNIIDLGMIPTILIVLLLMAVSMAIVYSPQIVVFFRLKNMPEKNERVKVLESEQEFSGKNIRTITVIEFSDGSRKIFKIRSRDKESETVDAIVANDTGVLTYKKLGNEVRFIGFKKDS